MLSRSQLWAGAGVFSGMIAGFEMLRWHCWDSPITLTSSWLCFPTAAWSRMWAGKCSWIWQMKNFEIEFDSAGVAASDTLYGREEGEDRRRGEWRSGSGLFVPPCWEAFLPNTHECNAKLIVHTHIFKHRMDGLPQGSSGHRPQMSEEGGGPILSLCSTYLHVLLNL